VVKAFKVSKNITIASKQPNGTAVVEVAKQDVSNALDDNIYIEPINCLKKEANKMWLMPDLKIKITKF
jgi:hypothetical protein